MKKAFSAITKLPALSQGCVTKGFSAVAKLKGWCKAVKKASSVVEKLSVLSQSCEEGLQCCHKGRSHDKAFSAVAELPVLSPSCEEESSRLP